jgi:hypothetical protein
MEAWQKWLEAIGVQVLINQKKFENFPHFLIKLLSNLISFEALGIALLHTPGMSSGLIGQCLLALLAVV